MDEQNQDSTLVNNQLENENVAQAPAEEAPAEMVAEASAEEGAPNGELPPYAKERLGRMQKKHQKEMRRLQAQMAELQGRLATQPQQQPAQQQYDDYGSEQSPNDMHAYVNHAVQTALRAKEEQEHRAVQEQKKEHVNKQYEALADHLDSGSDMYDDFDDVVRGEKTPFTTHMRDGALLLPTSGSGSAAHVLYKLGKNPEELKRVSQLHPLDQARELIKLSRALEMGGNQEGKNSNSEYKPIGNIKNNPAYSSAQGITEQTPMSELKRRARNGWKEK
jgi:hypothetical protein